MRFIAETTRLYPQNNYGQNKLISACLIKRGIQMKLSIIRDFFSAVMDNLVQEHNTQVQLDTQNNVFKRSVR
jgi:hypothetical protein